MGVEHVGVAFSIVTNRTRPWHHFTHSLATLSALGLRHRLMWSPSRGVIRKLIFDHQRIVVPKASVLHTECESDGLVAFCSVDIALLAHC